MPENYFWGQIYSYQYRNFFWHQYFLYQYWDFFIQILSLRLYSIKCLYLFLIQFFSKQILKSNWQKSRDRYVTLCSWWIGCYPPMQRSWIEMLHTYALVHIFFTKVALCSQLMGRKLMTSCVEQNLNNICSLLLPLSESSWAQCAIAVAAVFLPCPKAERR